LSLLPSFGFLELLVIGIVALIVVGPKDLPRLMREIGKVFAKMKRMASEFTSAFDQMAREAEMEDLRREMQELRKNNPVQQFKDEVDLSVKSITDDVDQTMRQAEQDLDDGSLAARDQRAPGDEAAVGKPEGGPSEDGKTVEPESPAPKAVTGA